MTTAIASDNLGRSLVVQLPNYHIGSCELFSTFASEAKKLRSVDQLQAFIRRWRPVWLMGNRYKAPHVAEIDRLIGIGSFDPEDALRCIRRVTTTRKPCRHVDPHPIRSKKRRLRKKHLKRLDERRAALGHTLCVGMEIFMPFTILQGIQISNHFGVPDGCALHQAFCDTDDHSECF